MKPNRPIRRFDVFAEYQRLKALESEKQPSDVAKGYGIWLAKVVAARKFRKSSTKQAKEGKGSGKEKDEPEELVENKWRTLDGTPQTDALFDKEIVERMGGDFYQNVFALAIADAFRSGKDYTEIRDTIRKDWKPK
jgi:hypothetical protein